MEGEGRKEGKYEGRKGDKYEGKKVEKEYVAANFCKHLALKMK